MAIVEKIKAKWRSDKWAEPSGVEPRDEYGRARWIAEGEGAGATKAALALGAAVVGLSAAVVTLGIVCYSLYQDRSTVRMVAVPENAGATTVFKATVIQGELQSNTNIKQWIIARWLDQWRGVTLDEPNWNRGYYEAQAYMCGTVQARIAETVKPDPNDPHKLTPEKMLKERITRRVIVNHITPRGGEDANSFRLDWTETIYQNSKVLGQGTATADLELKHFPVQDTTTALLNPYGLYVCTFDWSPGIGR